MFAADSARDRGAVSPKECRRSGRGGWPLLIAGLFLLGSALVRYGVIEKIEPLAARGLFSILWLGAIARVPGVALALGHLGPPSPVPRTEPVPLTIDDDLDGAFGGGGSVPAGAEGGAGSGRTPEPGVRVGGRGGGRGTAGLAGRRSSRRRPGGSPRTAGPA
ncbi:hypothetical protein D5H75_02675 [Bailinhaonella thermotolerans]|uniref:Uncharacterized protein n=1 Tax=Bailinhaonella thermotolerans TaxID=1070861 RepID=A0A3A4B9Y4_9ACTN|nr:hypothetical protein D5H75_02675 [Bailinhaonella thermotolerans]